MSAPTINMILVDINKNEHPRKDFELAFSEACYPNSYFIYTDKFNRKWKLEPVKSENIMMPFIVTPIPT